MIIPTCKTKFPRVSLRTDTLEAVVQGDAGGSVVAGGGVAHAEHLVTQGPGVTWTTHAAEGVYPVYTGGALVAGIGGALVNFILAQPTCEARGTNTGERSNAVDTYPIILTTMVPTIINILFTKFTLKSILAITYVWF